MLRKYQIFKTLIINNLFKVCDLYINTLEKHNNAQYV
jgi:hypothetical protein